MDESRRRPLTRETFASLAQSAGMSMSEAEMDALLVPSAAIWAAVERLDTLPLGEPAAIFVLRPAEATPEPQAE